MKLKKVQLQKSCFCCKHYEGIGSKVIRCALDDSFEQEHPFMWVCDKWENSGEFNLTTPWDICTKCKHLGHDQREGYVCFGPKDYRATCGGQYET